MVFCTIFIDDYEKTISRNSVNSLVLKIKQDHFHPHFLWETDQVLPGTSLPSKIFRGRIFHEIVLEIVVL